MTEAVAAISVNPYPSIIGQHPNNILMNVRTCFAHGADPMVTKRKLPIPRATLICKGEEGGMEKGCKVVFYDGTSAVKPPMREAYWYVWHTQNIHNTGGPFTYLIEYQSIPQSMGRSPMIQASYFLFTCFAK